MLDWAQHLGIWVLTELKLAKTNPWTQTAAHTILTINTLSVTTQTEFYSWINGLVHSMMEVRKRKKA